MNKNNPALWGIKNLSGAEWSFATQSSEVKKIGNGSVIPVANDLEITFDGITAKVEKQGVLLWECLTMLKES